MTKEIYDKISVLEQEILQKKAELVALKKAVPEIKVENYLFSLPNNETISLEALFGDSNELFIVHNMGKSCSYCTMWADGFNGIYHHLIKKAPFVVTSPDTPDVQEDFAASRGWKFPIVSTQNTTFKEDFGFAKDGYYYPGVSTFRKDKDGNIYHHAKTALGPGDDYCAVWHLLDLLPSGRDGYTASKKMMDSNYSFSNNIAVQVNNYEKAIPFYENVLGMTVHAKSDAESHLSLSGMNFYIEDNHEGNTYFDFAVENFDEAKNSLLDHGCLITKEYSEKSVMIADPYGLKFHLFEVKN
jgi:predicted dithiol-disulfide oxidoreductase (DUF899 family)/predicted enzyme related to lactoylglutathione lyase